MNVCNESPLIYRIIGKCFVTYISRLRIKAVAEVGGFKTVYLRSRAQQNSTYTSSSPSSYSFVDLKFDIVHPKHCTQLDNCRNGTTSIPSINAGPDITEVCIYMAV